MSSAMSSSGLALHASSDVSVHPKVIRYTVSHSTIVKLGGNSSSLQDKGKYFPLHMDKLQLGQWGSSELRLQDLLPSASPTFPTTTTTTKKTSRIGRTHPEWWLLTSS